MNTAQIKKVLLITPPNTLPVDSVRRIGEPLSLLYLIPPLNRAGYETEVFDATCEGYGNVSIKGGYLTYGSDADTIKNKIKEFSPDAVGVNCMFTAREKDSLAVCKLVKEVSSDIKVIMGGLQPTLFPEKMINTGMVDYVIMNEGEFRLVKLLDSVNKGINDLDFDGVAYKCGENVKINPSVSFIEDLDKIPFPDRDAVDMKKYFDIGRPYAPFSAERNVAQILCTRGCFNRCNFCSTVQYWGQKVRSRSADNIVKELRIMIEKYDIKEVQIIDDNLTADRKLSKELFTKMKELNLKWCTPHGLMFNTLDKELIRLMAESGAYQLTFAVESASDRVLKEIIRKNVRLDKVKELVEEAHRYDISVHGMFLTGFPGETREEIMKTMDFPFSAGFDSVSLFIVNPLPGSELYQECIDKDYLAGDYNTMDFKSANIKIPKDSSDYGIDPEELVRMVDDMTRRFNEWAKRQYPDRWKKKFEKYLKLHPEEKEKVMGRVT